MDSRPTVTLLTDFGTGDYYVAAVRGTLLRLAPTSRLVDLSHQVPAGDVEAASNLLAAAAPTFPAGTVHLAVVDPGVGSERRILAAEWTPGSSRQASGLTGAQLFVAPDNGLLTPLLEAAPAGLGGSVSIRGVERRELFLEGPGSTFHGRDRFAPVAAALARGEPLRGLGSEVSDPVRLDLPRPRRERLGDATVLRGRVVRVDRFGNLVTDIPSGWLAGELGIGTGIRRGGSRPGPRVEVAGRATDRWIDHYAELEKGEPGALVGSLGTVELSLRGASLAERWGVGRGTAVRIGPASR